MDALNQFGKDVMKVVRPLCSLGAVFALMVVLVCAVVPVVALWSDPLRALALVPGLFVDFTKNVFWPLGVLWLCKE